MPFRSLGLRPEIVSALDRAGYPEPTPIQKAAIPQVLAGHDVVGIAQTGTGKTAAFVLPMLHVLAADNRKTRGMRALVVVPTRELAVQVEQSVRKYAPNLRLSSATIYGGVGEQPQIAALRRGVDLVIATPGRLLDLMSQGHVDYGALQFVVLDEADRMLDMGFLPDIRKIMRALPVKRQTLLFSATFSPEIEKTAAEFLTSPKTVEVSKRATPADTVTQNVVMVTKDQKIPMLFELLKDPVYDAVLVFVRTRHGADKVARRLSQHGITTGTLHSSRSQNQRLDALKRFKAGEVRVLVATDIAARGIDVQGISHVINFDFPQFPEDYVHRIGRTGRAKAVGDAVSFVMPDEMTTLRSVERFIGRGIPRITTPPEIASIKSEPRAEGAMVPQRRDGARERSASRGIAASRTAADRQGRSARASRPASTDRDSRGAHARDRETSSRGPERPGVRSGDRRERSSSAPRSGERHGGSASRSQGGRGTAGSGRSGAPGGRTSGPRPGGRGRR